MAEGLACQVEVDSWDAESSDSGHGDSGTIKRAPAWNRRASRDAEESKAQEKLTPNTGAQAETRRAFGALKHTRVLRTSVLK